STTLHIRVTWIHSFVSFVHFLLLPYLVFRPHHLLVSPKYFHLALHFMFSFWPSQVFKNIYILLMYSPTYSES
ncbi:uncharacterized protein BJ212DRAFT_1360987, partial [Suillus subaureus]